jgi:hypothetical protein
VEKTERKLEEEFSCFSQAMGPTVAALYCAIGPDFVTKVDRRSFSEAVNRFIVAKLQMTILFNEPEMKALFRGL